MGTITRLAAALVVLAVVGACSSQVGGQPVAAVAAQDAKFTPSEINEDPSENIEGVERITYNRGHASSGQRVDYQQSPPFGGAHDQVWADCNGVVYAKPVRNEHMVHSLEHGAVWIAYNPDEISDDTLYSLMSKVEGQPYLMMSPYPGLSRPLSLQSWGHRLMLDDADERVDQFILALRENPYQTPEPGGSCDSADPTVFDPADPPPFDPTPPGPDAFPEDGGG